MPEAAGFFGFEPFRLRTIQESFSRAGLFVTGGAKGYRKGRVARDAGGVLPPFSPAFYVSTNGEAETEVVVIAIHAYLLFLYSQTG